MVDFVVEIPKGRAPIVLQLSDPQLIDASQAVKGRLAEGEELYWAKDKKEERGFGYIRETVRATAPDLIIIAGDLTYGEFDHDGSALTSFVEFMDGLGIPWAPVLGNHETESRMGADWQCAQLENAEFCLFKQRELTGNGNYTVGIKQAGKLIRVFYMMDTNSGAPSEASVANGHSNHPAGFGEDQIFWLEESIREIRGQYPEVKISFAFHIPMAAFESAFEKYGYVSDVGAKVYPIRLDGMDPSGKDFGMLMHPLSCWDQDRRVWKLFKTLGVDSVFVGHIHGASAGATYEGIRCQLGLKSTTYDSNIYINESGAPVESWLPAGTPVVGGTVIGLSAADGAIECLYHYECKNVTFES